MRSKKCGTSTSRRPTTIADDSPPSRLMRTPEVPACGPAVPPPDQPGLLLQQIQLLTAAVEGLQRMMMSPVFPPPEPHRSRPCGEPSPRPRAGPPRSRVHTPRCSLSGSPTISPSPAKRGRAPTLPSEMGSAALQVTEGAAREDDLNYKLCELERQVQALRDQPGRQDADQEFSTESPFVLSILAEPIPLKFKMPHLEPYNGSADPLDHLKSYKALMMLQGASDYLLCKAFPATLRAAARMWFSSLKPASVHSFEQMGRMFATHFAASRRQRRSSDSLFNLRQREGEPLGKFIDRFSAATLEVRDLDQSIAMSALRTGIHYLPFRFSLEKRFPADFPEMLTRARKYAKAEEATTSKPDKWPREEKPLGGLKRRREEPDLSRRGPPRREKAPFRPRSPSPRPKSPPLRFQRYTPLTSPPSKILEIQGRGDFKVPPRMKPSEARRRSNKYCRYHREYGHDTDDCFQLKDEIEALIRRGKLNQFVRRAPADEKRPDQTEPGEQVENRPTAGTINTITGQLPQASSSRRPGEPPETKLPKRSRTHDLITFLTSPLLCPVEIMNTLFLWP